MSKAVVYYFSGTGNSLTIARQIAGKINGDVISIPSVMSQNCISPDADVIGIVFPVYFATNDNGGVPLVVGRFVDRLEGIGRKYVFAVCTHSGGPGATIEHFGRMIKARGGRLAAGFEIQMSIPPAPTEKIRDALFYKKLHTSLPDPRKRCQPAYDRAAKKIDAVCAYVSARKEGTFETSTSLKKLLSVPYVLIVKPVFMSRYRQLSGSSGNTFSDLIPGADRSFRCDETCSGCGTCARVCPADNIEMTDGRPVWQHRCENCLACYAWCPKGAIGGEIVAYNERYHHPDVRLSEMIKANGRPATTNEAARPDGGELRQVADLVDRGKLKVTMTEVLPMKDAAKAHAQSETGHVPGKIVLEASDYVSAERKMISGKGNLKLDLDMGPHES